MNSITFEKVEIEKGYSENYLVIDGTPLPKHLENWAVDFQNDELKNIQPFMGLAPAWTFSYYNNGDTRFIWELVEQDSTVLPILICHDDLDLDCIVIVVEVKKTKDFVYWDRIGFVIHENHDSKEWVKSGILHIESYTDEDWEKYAHIAFEDVYSEILKEWWHENSTEERYRRNMNYTLPYYKTEGNVFWIKEMNWVFERRQYNEMVEGFKYVEMLDSLKYQLKYSNNLSVKECLHLMTIFEKENQKILDEHLKDYDEILLHVLATDLISRPLIELLKNSENVAKIKVYCTLIELMWKKGETSIVNVVNVSILESISDCEYIWNEFGKFISEEFKTYINEDVLTFNIAMGGVSKLQ